ncbi:MAG TPA: phosphoribosylformylglycinamidine synthase [Lentisphaeria bacterium]|nr:phosphoribosylformylglycinamidine synthase [Lentisphaeria bacterium]
MYHRLQVSPKTGVRDARGEETQERIQRYLGISTDRVQVRDVYSLFADLTADQAAEIATCCSNPVLQTTESTDVSFDWLIAVGYLPGVTDNVSRTLRRVIRDAIGRPLREDEEVYSSVEYLISGPGLSRESVATMATDLLANALIQSVAIRNASEWREQGPHQNRPRYDASDVEEGASVEIDLTGDDAQLQAISDKNTLALTLAEMKAIRDYFSGQKSERRALDLPTNPTDCELEILAQTWSEHCKHKIFDAIIHYRDDAGNEQTVDGCFPTFIRAATFEIGEDIDWLVSVFHDNAGVVRFNDTLNLVYKAETHNSPSALDPYGGAMTGIVGVNRDPMGTGLGADLTLNVWGYCFGSPATPAEDVPESLFHPARLRDCVHHGVIDGGNQSGIPYAIGWEYFDPRYLGKPLVFCGTVGTLPRTINGQASEDKSILPGDFVVMAGGQIGKDGIHGATFSSEELHGSSPSQAVQIGDPITQKMLADFLYVARDRGLFRFITDNGAGGLSSSIGEMATQCGGACLELSNAPLKYVGLRPWEILLSEAQERMSFAVPPEDWDELKALADSYEVEISNIGVFTDDGWFDIRYEDERIARIELEFMHKGYPRLEIPAVWAPPQHDEPTTLDQDPSQALLDLLARDNITSGETHARQYDHEVKGLSVIKPYVGIDNNVASDAVVSMLEPLTTEGVILAAAVLPRYSDIDTYHMTASVIDLAVRRTIAVGGEMGRIAGLDNFCWPDPVESPKTPDGAYKAAQLVRSNQALYDYCKAYGVPCISGKDSMKNDSTRGGRKISIPPTLLFSTITPMADITRSVTLDVKRARDLVYVVGATLPELGGSEYLAMQGYTGNAVPKVDADEAIRTYQAMAKATAAGLCRSIHTPALGGLAVALAKSAIGGQLGIEADLSLVPTAGDLDLNGLLFSETNSRFVVTVCPDNWQKFEALFEADQAVACIGKVTRDPALVLHHRGSPEVELNLAELTAAYTRGPEA